MSIVIDSNVLVAAAINRALSKPIRTQLKRWHQNGEDMHAPWLLRYEVANALARSVALGVLGESKAVSSWKAIDRLGKRITFHDIRNVPRVIAIAKALKRQNAYDAAYVALAEEMKTNVWTLDGSLARNAAQTGLPVKLIEAR